MEPVDDPRLYSRRYQVTHLIARGGMAMVYRAQDTLLNRAVALKILYPELSDDPSFVERFRREAQAAANLSHPNIVPVFDWGEDQGTYFIVMELVEGTSLADTLRGGTTVTPARSSQIVAQVAAALGYAHRNGVVHRDVKPGNILITSDGQVKVTDFGIAQAVSSDDHLAEAGSVMGTATYFSPEQAEGAAVDGRSDVYSLGVVLYEMLVGRPPFVGGTPVEVSSQHVHGTVPPIAQFTNDVPRDLDAIVMEALGKSPGQRYQTADEFRADLIRFSEGQPVMASRTGAFYGADATRAVSTVAPGERTQAVPIMTGPRTDIRRRRRNPILPILLVVIVLLAAVGAGYLYANRPKAVNVPNLVGLSVDNARQELINAGLTVGKITLVNSKVTKNNVISQDPKDGKSVAKGQSVAITVSEGVKTSTVQVPQLVGLQLAAAETEVLHEGLSPNPEPTTTPPEGTTVPNQVLAQTPLFGTKVQTGTVVNLVYLSPDAKFPLLDVSGDTQAVAGAQLGNSQLIVNKTVGQVCSNTIKPGLVVSTVPVEGTLVEAGTPVKLIVSSGPCQVYVPNVIGDSETQATNKMEGQGFIPTYGLDPTAICPPGASQTVTQQSVAGGSQATYGSTINMLVCSAMSSGTPPT